MVYDENEGTDEQYLAHAQRVLSTRVHDLVSFGNFLPARSAGWALVHFSAALIDRRQRSFGRLIIGGQRLRTWPRTLQGSKMHDSQVRAHARSKTFMEGIAKAVKDEAASQIAASRTVRGTWSISRQHDRTRRHIKTSKPTSQ